MVTYPSENGEEGVTVARNDSDVDAICKGRGRPCVEAREEETDPFTKTKKKSLGETTEALS